MTPEQERELALLMAAAQRGDRVAYETLLHGLGHVIRLYVRRRLPASLHIDDIAQDVLMAIHKARHTWNPARPFAPWFYAVMHRRMVDAIRRQKRVAAREEPMDATPPVVWSASPEAGTIAREDLAQAMRALTPAQRVVIEQLKLREFSVRDVARQTGMSESNVKVTAHRGYALLRRLLSGMGYGD